MPRLETCRWLQGPSTGPPHRRSHCRRDRGRFKVGLKSKAGPPSTGTLPRPILIAVDLWIATTAHRLLRRIKTWPRRWWPQEHEGSPTAYINVSHDCAMGELQRCTHQCDLAAAHYSSAIATPWRCHGQGANSSSQIPKGRLREV